MHSKRGGRLPGVSGGGGLRLLLSVGAGVMAGERRAGWTLWGLGAALQSGGVFVPWGHGPGEPRGQGRRPVWHGRMEGPPPTRVFLCGMPGTAVLQPQSSGPPTPRVSPGPS